MFWFLQGVVTRVTQLLLNSVILSLSPCLACLLLNLQMIIFQAYPGYLFQKFEQMELDHVKRSIPELTQIGPLLVTHWGLSGHVILLLSARGAREFFIPIIEGLDGDVPWATVSNSNLSSVELLLKQFPFKGQFKDEFVTAGGFPLSEVSLNTKESKKCQNLFFAVENLALYVRYNPDYVWRTHGDGTLCRAEGDKCSLTLI